MRKQSLLSRNSGTYTSPGTPDYQNTSEIQKGWCSERVPLSSTSKRHIGASALSGRALPSKWDDAERWITSPLSASNINKNLFAQPQRKPKSKSGPLGPQGVGGFSSNLPFSTGVLVPNCVQLHYGCGSDGLVNNVDSGSAVDRVTSLPGWSDTLSESSEPSSQDDKFEGVKDSETTVSGDVSRRDRATQMSPSESQSSSSKRTLSFSTSPPLFIPNVGSHSNSSDRVEVKDLQVDITATMTRQSKKNGAKNLKNDSPDVKVVTSWESSETSKSLSKLQREEAKINAWENLQKEKAEAAIQKLEMKLEKRRAASMDKILNKLRSAQTKAQEMRNSVSGSCDYPRAETSHRPTLFCMFPLSGKGKKR